MNLLVGALTTGLILGLLALGVFVSFRIFAFSDITAEGSITLGAAVTASLLVHGHGPAAATIASIVAGMGAGAITGVLHTRFRINGLLSGILVMTALYSINLHVMGKSNLPLLDQQTLATQAESLGKGLAGAREQIPFLGWEVSMRDASLLVCSLIVICLTGLILYIFLRTDIGTAMRATGDNSQMIRAQGVDSGTMITLGLALSNGLIALSGSLLAQYQGFADVQMGIGMVVWGLASVIIGEALVGTRELGFSIVGVMMGSVVFRLLIAIALRWGLDPNDLKLTTALFVFFALILPDLLERFRARAGRSEARA